MTDGLISERLFDFIMSRASGTPVILFSSDGTVLKHNPAARDLFGDAQLEGGFQAMFVDFVRPPDLQAWAGESGARLRCVSTSCGLPENLMFEVVKLETGYLAYGEHDAKEMNALRTSLTQTNQALGNASRELHKMNAELKRLAEQKNLFLGMAAHDLRGPIGNIASLCDFMLEDPRLQGPPNREWLQMIKDLTHFMIGLLADLLDVSAIDAGKLILHAEDRDIGTLVSQAILLGGRHAKKNNTVIDWTPPPVPVQIHVDPRKFVQATSNLISNAIKYSPRGGRIKIEIQFPPGAFRLLVWDQGPGVPEEVQHKLFHAFQTGTATSQTSETSTGLGLMIVKKIVEAHKGKAGVMSEPGSGSCFWFELPGDCLVPSPPETGGS